VLQVLFYTNDAVRDRDQALEDWHSYEITMRRGQTLMVIGQQTVERRREPLLFANACTRELGQQDQALQERNPQQNAPRRGRGLGGILTDTGATLIFSSKESGMP